MRMWNIKTQFMCNQHLLGEHLECHMFVGCINKKKNLKGYIDKGLLNTSKLKSRHEELVIEMKERGMKHKSPLPEFNCKDEGKVDDVANIEILFKRCENCKRRMV